MFCVGVFCLHAYLHTTHVSGAHRGPKRALDPLELELQMVACQHVGAGESNLGPLQEQSVLSTTEPSV